MLSITVPGPIVPWKRTGESKRGRRYTPPRLREYKMRISGEAMVQLGPGKRPGKPDGAKRGRRMDLPAFRVEVFAYFAVPKSWPKRDREAALDGRIPHTSKPDGDNVLKLIDALTGLVWLDDAQVVLKSVQKMYSDTERLVIRVEQVQVPSMPSAKEAV